MKDSTVTCDDTEQYVPNRNICQSQINILLEAWQSFGSTLFDFLVWWLVVNGSDYSSLPLCLIAEPPGPVWIDFLFSWCIDLFPCWLSLPTRMEAPWGEGLCWSCSVSGTMLQIEWGSLCLIPALCVLSFLALALFFFFFLSIHSSSSPLGDNTPIYIGADVNWLCHHFPP